MEACAVVTPHSLMLKRKHNTITYGSTCSMDDVLVMWVFENITSIIFESNGDEIVGEYLDLTGRK
jgi:hypothetical protein